MSTSDRPPGRAVAALAGVLSVAAALGAGHLVAGLLSEPSASPFLAVGNAVVDRTPNPVKSFAISVFGSDDKTALLTGMAVVIALVAAAAGIASRRRSWPGLAVVAALGLLGGLAVVEQTSGAWTLLAPIAALVAGLAVFAGLHARARANPRRDTGRRGLLLGFGGVAVGAALAGAGGALLAGRRDVAASRRAVGPLVPARPAPPIPPGAAFPELGTPTFLTPASEFYRVDVNLTVPQLRAQEAVLRIHGMVDREIELPFSDIVARPLVERTITMTCVSNPVGGPYVSTANFIGVPLADLLAEAGVHPDAEQLVGRAVDGFTIGTPLDRVLGHPDALLAIGMNGEPLLPEHGFPMRAVVPGLYGYVSATKWLSELELTTFAFDPYWERRGWDGDSAGIVPIKISSRIDAPAGFAEVPAGEVVLAGTSWAQGVGIAGVEVRLDDGEWRPAELGAAVDPDTWRMWYLRVPLRPGRHSATVRAIDRAGTVQTGERVDPINAGPDGATGRHTVIFSVT